MRDEDTTEVEGRSPDEVLRFWICVGLAIILILIGAHVAQEHHPDTWIEATAGAVQDVIVFVLLGVVILRAIEPLLLLGLGVWRAARSFRAAQHPDSAPFRESGAARLRHRAREVARDPMAIKLVVTAALLIAVQGAASSVR